MAPTKMPLTVFTKPWREMPLPELGDFVRGMGFDGVELPVRPGYQVTPEEVAKLPDAARILSDRGVKIGSVAGPFDEPTIAACAEAGVPIIRDCPVIPKDMSYLEGIEALQQEWDALLPLLEKRGVALGIQNHAGRCIPAGMHLLHAVGKYDPASVCAVWDAGHNGVEGEQVDLALDIVWSHLRLVNLKSAYWRRTNPPDAETAEWRIHWTTGRRGRANWPWVLRELAERGYAGDLCFSAEYAEHDRVNELIVEDVRYVRSLL